VTKGRQWHNRAQIGVKWSLLIGNLANANVDHLAETDMTNLRLLAST
jgi:hypothetical protein